MEERPLRAAPLDRLTPPPVSPSPLLSIPSPAKDNQPKALGSFRSKSTMPAGGRFAISSRFIQSM